ncbi:endonuclease/exonuclease/phosphatase family protein [Bifidobacterium vespertilionis]|nr:endonuclease/exonuclease/phosphatase family protein [Bifidobacterium vespertilionis]
MLWVLWIIVLMCILWIALAALPAGREKVMPLPYMIALIPFLWVPMAVVAAIAAFSLHEWGLMCGAIATGIATQIYQSRYQGTALHAGAAKPAGRSSGQAKPDASGESAAGSVGSTESAGQSDESAAQPARAYRLMTLNCRYGRADAKAIVAAVRAHNITVLALQEMNDDLFSALNEAGLGRILPYSQCGAGKATDNGGYNGIYTAAEPIGRQRDAIMIPAADVPSLSLPLPGRPAGELDADGDAPTITFAAAHTKSPMRSCRDWSNGIIGLGELAERTEREDHDIMVVMGDLNGQIEHPSFRALLDRGFTDASLSLKSGAHPTFPSWLPWPRIELDHVLFTPGAKAVAVGTLAVKGTDHLALTATLEV